jgi:monothiol glutaredoxin
MSLPEIDVTKAKELLAKGATFVDVRDPNSYQAARIPGAFWLHDGNLAQFTSSADKDAPLIVYCYKGNASKAAVLHLMQSGFKEAYNLSVGFNGWDGEKESGIPTGEAPEGLKLTELAKAKLSEFLAAESKETAVRVTIEGSRFGLSLDEPRGGDLSFTLEGVPFALDQLILGAVKGLTIGFVEEGDTVGFSLEGGTIPKPPGDDERLAEIKKLIADNKIMLFMKGTAMAPMCGFSARTVQALRDTGKPFGDKNVLEDPRFRYVLSDHSSWPTIPQVFVDGKFIGGCDIVTEMATSGELQKLVDAAFAEANA